jgi:hypothetical protein
MGATERDHLPSTAVERGPEKGTSMTIALLPGVRRDVRYRAGEDAEAEYHHRR